jgi:hypothetical protein
MFYPLATLLFDEMCTSCNASIGCFYCSNKQSNTRTHIRVIVEYVRAVVGVLELNSVKAYFCESRNDAPDFMPTTFVVSTT